MLPSIKNIIKPLWMSLVFISIFFLFSYFFLKNVVNSAFISSFYTDSIESICDEIFGLDLLSCMEESKCKNKCTEKIDLKLKNNVFSSIGIYINGSAVFIKSNNAVNAILNSYFGSIVHYGDGGDFTELIQKKKKFIFLRKLPILQLDKSIDENDIKKSFIVISYDRSDQFNYINSRVFFVFTLSLFVVALIFISFSNRNAIVFQSVLSIYKKTDKIKNKMIEVKNEDVSKSKFFASFSHELRTPLNSIIGFSDLLYNKADTIDNEKQKRYIKNILNSGNYLLTLVNDLMDFFKLESKGLSINLEKTNLRRVITQSVEILKIKSDEKGISIENKFKNDNKTVLVDPKRLQQVLMNLISNSIKFTASGGIIEISVKDLNKKNLIIVVRDNGIGVKKEDIPKIFSAFGQVDSERKKLVTDAKGSGLGLNITKQLMNLMGGDILFESELNKGTTVSLVINKDC